MFVPLARLHVEADMEVQASQNADKVPIHCLLIYYLDTLFLYVHHHQYNRGISGLVYTMLNQRKC